MAIRLSIALNTSPESWLNRQMQFDLWQAEEKRGSLKVERIKGSGPGPKGEGN
jgi:plasmid maintenance system antidote protein VapI